MYVMFGAINGQGTKYGRYVPEGLVLIARM